MNRLWILVAIAMLLLAASCGGGDESSSLGGTESGQPAAGPGLPSGASGNVGPDLQAPLDMPAPAEQAELLRSGSFTLADGRADGSAFSGVLPSQRLSAAGSSGVFAPAFPPEGAEGDKAAYGIWSFQLPAYFGTPVTADFSWSDAPAAGLTYIGLANWATGRWNWKPLQSDNSTNYGAITNYIDNADICLMAVVVLGTDAVILDEIQLSTPQPPVASIVPDTDSGVAPLSVSFDGSGSTDEDGTITGYEWDLDGDGLFNETGFEQDAQGGNAAIFDYGIPGSYTATLRVTDNDGNQGEASVEINVAASQPPTADLQADVTDGPKPLAVTFNATGSSDPDGSVTDYEWDFDGDGDYGEAGEEQDAAGDPTPVAYVYGSVGSYEAKVRVTDNDGGKDSASLTINVSNTPPTAGLDSDISEGNAPFSVSFNAGTSSDPGGMIVDYEWDLDGDGAFNEAGTPEEAARGVATPASYMYSDPGLFTVSMRVTDDDTAQDTATLVITSHGWLVITLDDADGAAAVNYQHIDLFDGRPVVAAYAQTLDEIRVSVSSTPLGLDPADWTTVTVPGGMVGQEMSMCALTAGPAIAQRDQTNNRLVYYHATGDGSDTAHWNGPVVVDTTSGAGRIPQLAMVNGNPAIYFRQDSTSDVRYRRSTTADGALSGDWAASVDIETAGTNVTNNHSLAVINGNPAVVYYNYVNPSDFLKFARSTDASGTAGTWTTKFNLDSSNGSGAWTNYGLVTVGGFPATIFADDANLIYKRATNATGSAWAGDVNIMSSGLISSYGRMAMINGNPAIAYTTNTNIPTYRRSSTASGDNAADWNTAESIIPPGSVCFHIKLIEIDGKPAVVFSNATSSSTMYGIKL